MIKLSKVNRFIGFLSMGLGTLCFLVMANKTIEERFKNLVYLIFFCLIFLYIIISFIIMLKEREYQSDIWNIEYIKDNLSKEQWKEYKNKLKKLNSMEKWIYSRELLNWIEEKEDFELEKFKNEVKADLESIGKKYNDETYEKAFQMLKSFKNNLSEEQWQEYLNKVKDLNSEEKWTYTRKFIKKIQGENK